MFWQIFAIIREIMTKKYEHYTTDVPMVKNSLCKNNVSNGLDRHM